MVGFIDRVGIVRDFSHHHLYLKYNYMGDKQCINIGARRNGLNSASGRKLYPRNHECCPN